MDEPLYSYCQVKGYFSMILSFSPYIAQSDNLTFDQSDILFCDDCYQCEITEKSLNGKLRGYLWYMYQLYYIFQRITGGHLSNYLGFLQYSTRRSPCTVCVCAYLNRSQSGSIMWTVKNDFRCRSV